MARLSKKKAAEASAAIERFRKSRKRNIAARDLAIEMLSSWAIETAEQYVNTRGLNGPAYQAFLDEARSDAGLALVRAVEEADQKKGPPISYIRRRIIGGVIDSLRIRLGREGSARANVRKEMQRISMSGEDKGEGEDTPSPGTVFGLPDPRASGLLRFEAAEELSHHIARISSPRHRAAALLRCLGWTLVEIGAAFEVTESRASQMLKEIRENRGGGRRGGSGK